MMYNLLKIMKGEIRIIIFIYGKNKFNEVKTPTLEVFVCCCISDVCFQMFPCRNNIIASAVATCL